MNVGNILFCRNFVNIIFGKNKKAAIFMTAFSLV